MEHHAQLKSIRMTGFFVKKIRRKVNNTKNRRCERPQRTVVWRERKMASVVPRIPHWNSVDREKKERENTAEGSDGQCSPLAPTVFRRIFSYISTSRHRCPMTAHGDRMENCDGAKTIHSNWKTARIKLRKHGKKGKIANVCGRRTNGRPVAARVPHGKPKGAWQLQGVL